MHRTGRLCAALVAMSCGGYGAMPMKRKTTALLGVLAVVVDNHQHVLWAAAGVKAG